MELQDGAFTKHEPDALPKEIVTTAEVPVPRHQGYLLIQLWISQWCEATI